MARSRVSGAEQLELAIDDLGRLGVRLPQIDIVPRGPDGVDFRPNDGSDGWPAKVLAFDAVGEAQVRQLLASEARSRKVVVANRISAPARRLLATSGWSWLDRRVGAHLAFPARDIDVWFPSQGRAESSNVRSQVLRRAPMAAEGPIRGRAGIAYAAALLLSPNEPPSLRSVARSIGMSPTAVSNAVAHLVDHGLVRAATSRRSRSCSGRWRRCGRPRRPWPSLGARRGRCRAAAGRPDLLDGHEAVALGSDAGRAPASGATLRADVVGEPCGGARGPADTAGLPAAPTRGGGRRLAAPAAPLRRARPGPGRRPWTRDPRSVGARRRRRRLAVRAAARCSSFPRRWPRPSRRCECWPPGPADRPITLGR